MTMFVGLCALVLDEFFRDEPAEEVGTPLLLSVVGGGGDATCRYDLTAGKGVVVSLLPATVVFLADGRSLPSALTMRIMMSSSGVHSPFGRSKLSLGGSSNSPPPPPPKPTPSKSSCWPCGA